MSATADDYAWVDEWYDSVGQAYCLTLASGLAPAEFLARIGAVPDGTSDGLAVLAARSQDLWEQDPMRHAVIGVTAACGADGAPWALGVEVNGFLGVTVDVIAPLSAGTRLVSHYANAGAGRFYWLHDGEERLTFEPLFAEYRDGTEAEAIVQAMREAGFDLAEDSDNTDHPIASAFALAEYLTGVHVTRAFLQSARYELGQARYPGV